MKDCFIFSCTINVCGSGLYEPIEVRIINHSSQRAETGQHPTSKHDVNLNDARFGEVPRDIFTESWVSVTESILREHADDEFEFLLVQQDEAFYLKQGYDGEEGDEQHERERILASIT